MNPRSSRPFGAWVTAFRGRLVSPRAVLQPRRLSAGARVALAIILGVAVAVALLSAVSYVIFSRQIAGNLDDSLLREAEAYTAAVRTTMSEGPESMIQASETYMAERASDAAVLAVTFADGESLSTARTDRDVIAVGEATIEPTRARPSFSDMTVDGVAYRVATVPVKDSTGEVLGVFQAMLPTSKLFSTADELAWALLKAGVLVVVLWILLSGQVARATLKPLNAAAQTASQISHSSMSRRVPYNGPSDDVGTMVAAVNDMLDRLERAFGEQRRFLADASHEMRTPITIARGHLDVMVDEGKLDPDQEATIEIVTEELERTGNMLSDLLRLARLESGQPPPFSVFDMGEVVEEAVLRGQGLGRRRITLDLPEALPVHGSHDLLLQALLNLITNAVGHTEEDGRISVRCFESEEWVIVEVADDGPGIPEEDLERVFDRFYRSPGRPRPGGGGGSGLGLAISRRLVEVHGGSLTADNGELGGAVFQLRVPVHEYH